MDYSAFVCVAGEGGRARDEAGRNASSHFFHFCTGKAESEPDKNRCICKHLAVFETGVCLFYVHAPFQRSLSCEGEALLI